MTPYFCEVFRGLVRELEEHDAREARQFEKDQKAASSEASIEVAEPKLWGSSPLSAILDAWISAPPSLKAAAIGSDQLSWLNEKCAARSFRVRPVESSRARIWESWALPDRDRRFQVEHRLSDGGVHIYWEEPYVVERWDTQRKASVEAVAVALFLEHAHDVSIAPDGPAMRRCKRCTCVFITSPRRPDGGFCTKYCTTRWAGLDGEAEKTKEEKAKEDAVENESPWPEGWLGHIYTPSLEPFEQLQSARAAARNVKKRRKGADHAIAKRSGGARARARKKPAR